MPQLDGLRALAVGLVIMSHWAPGIGIFKSGAHIGVQMFFMLSGYLITGILLDARSKATSLGAGYTQILKGFYARRFLRIFPLYYAGLLIMALAGAPNILAHLNWHIAYLTNFWIAFNGWVGEASHLWSLAVEEQFYLVWPFLMLLVPVRYLWVMILLFILSSPLFNIWYGVYGSGLKTDVLPITSFNTLGTGALLALLERKGKLKGSKMIKWLGFTGVLGYVILQVLHLQPLFFGVVEDTFLTIGLLGLIFGASRGFNGLPGKALCFQPVLYLGKISYGLYLLHNFVPFLNTKWIEALGHKPMEALGPYGYFALNAIVLLLLSSASWYFFESKWNAYKKHFPYVKTNQLVAN